MRLNTSLVASDAFEKHLVNRRRKRGWAIKATGFTLMLTSMVDMFSMLVVFLLQTFSSSPEITLDATGIIEQTKDQEALLNETFESFKFIPYASVRVSYSF